MPRTATLAPLLALVLVGCGSGSTAAPPGPQTTRSPLPDVAASTGASPETTGTTTDEPTTDEPTTAPTSPDGGTASGVGTEIFSVTRLEPAQAARQAEIDPTGAVDGLGWTDAAGQNVVLLRRIETDRRGALLYADHVVYPNPRERIMLREVRDGVPECELDMTADFVAGSLRVADSNDDGLAEVSFAYRLNCAGDVSPDEQKLLVLEGGEKYILRGLVFSQFMEFQDPEAEPSQSSWPGSAYNDELQRFRGFAVQQ